MFDRETSPDESSRLFPGKDAVASILFEPIRIKTMSVTKWLVRSAAADNLAELGCTSESQGRDLVKQELLCC